MLFKAQQTKPGKRPHTEYTVFCPGLSHSVTRREIQLLKDKLHKLHSSDSNIRTAAIRKKSTASSRHNSATTQYTTIELGTYQAVLEFTKLPRARRTSQDKP